MSKRLGTLVKREMARQRLSSNQVAERAGGRFSAGWIRQLTSGRIDRPGRDKLTTLAEILGVELADLLSLSDQLGAVADLRQAGTASRPEWAEDLLTEMRAIRQLLLRALALALLLAACGGSEGLNADGYVAEYGGSRDVYAGILTGTNCAALQATFDRAAGNNDTAQAGSAEAHWTTGYMAATDARMQAVGCY